MLPFFEDTARESNMTMGNHLFLWRLQWKNHPRIWGFSLAMFDDHQIMAIDTLAARSSSWECRKKLGTSSVKVSGAAGSSVYGNPWLFSNYTEYFAGRCVGNTVTYLWKSSFPWRWYTIGGFSIGIWLVLVFLDRESRTGRCPTRRLGCAVPVINGYTALVYHSDRVIQ